MELIQKIGDKKSRKVLEKDIAEIRKLIPEIHAMCHVPIGFHGKGAMAISHCQVDQKDPMRFFVLVDGSTVINPTIKKCVGKIVRHDEGCMSYVDTTHLIGVDRYKKIIVSFTGLANADSELEEAECLPLTGDLAYIFQHEVDHMNGKHIYDKQH